MREFLVLFLKSVAFGFLVAFPFTVLPELYRRWR